MNAPMSQDQLQKRPNIIRRLYLWTVSWAEHPAGTWALFFIAFMESSFFPIPPDILLMALCFGAREKWLKYAFVCTAGSVLGGIAGWGIGWGLREAVAIPLLGMFDPTGETQHRIETMYGIYGFWGILIAAITPIPYKVFTVFSGMANYSLPLLIGASILGRGFRFYLVSGLIRLFGLKVRPFVERHLEWCFIVGLVVLLGGFAILKLV